MVEALGFGVSSLGEGVGPFLRGCERVKREWLPQLQVSEHMEREDELAISVIVYGS